MATAGGKKKPSGKVSVPDWNSGIPPVPVVVASPVKSVGEDMINGIILLILVGFLFPLTAMMYLDILEAKHEVKAQIQKVERLRREIEKEKRDASTDKSQ
jgi:hypothetical protein